MLRRIANRPGAGVILCLLILLGLALWLRWPTFGHGLWNVDEAIHAAIARHLIDGGVLYRDAPDIRHPLTYYAFAGMFAAFGENNLWAVRCLVALLVAGTALALFAAGRALRGPVAGIAAGGFYVLLASSALHAGDAYAAHTEWFVAFFSSTASAVFLTGGAASGPRRLFAAGALWSGAFLSKQPALLDAAAPAAALIYAAWRNGRPWHGLWPRLLALTAGWLAPVLGTVAFFLAHGALGDAVYWTWTYNLTHYGPEITTGDRLASLAMPFRLIGAQTPVLVALWAVATLVVLHQLAQRTAAPQEKTTNPGLVFVTVWSLSGLVGAASAGRGFDHYSIQFLAPFCLGGGLLAGWLATGAAAAARGRMARVLAAALLAVAAAQFVTAAWKTRGRTLPEDPSGRVAAYIRENSTPDDRIFVWGFHPDIYLFSDRRPASRYVITSFVTGLIPWTNTAPDRDTAYAAVPGAMDAVLHDLVTRPPLFIVDCSAGPNRHWQKYPLAAYPALHAFVQERYRLDEPHQFVPQGFRLFRLRQPGDPVTEDLAGPPLPAAIADTFKLGALGSPLSPIRVSARHGADASVLDGRLEYFVHAPSSLVFQLPAQASALRGGFGIRSGAYAPDNQGPTDGAEFIIRWRPHGGPEQLLLRQLLRPRDEPGDRGVRSFRVDLPPHHGGELELEIGVGPFDNSASDWTYWSDLLLENFR